MAVVVLQHYAAADDGGHTGILHLTMEVVMGDAVQPWRWSTFLITFRPTIDKKVFFFQCLLPKSNYGLGEYLD